MIYNWHAPITQIVNILIYEICGLELGFDMNAFMIAPCGMNCTLCIGHIREKNRCEGCNGNDQSKPQSCRTCTIVVCEKRLATKSGFCYDCPSYPCTRMKNLDKRYRTKYGMSMFENLAFIKEKGIDAFLKHEEERWKCPECGATFSVHRNECLNCGRPKGNQNI